MIRPVTQFTFGLAGNATPLLGNGWSFPEQNFAWTVGIRSRLRLPAPRMADMLVLELTVHGFCVPDRLPAQTLTVCADGVPLGSADVSEMVTLAFAVPPSATARGFLDVTLLHPGAHAPAALGINDDERVLAIAVFEARLWRTRPFLASAHTLPPIAMAANDRDTATRAACGLAPAELVSRFESIGQNCEFGLAQRAVQAEPPSLLRFAGIELTSLIRGLETAFLGIDDPAHFKVTSGMLDGRPEDMVFTERHWVRFHTGIFIDEMPDIAQVIARVRRYLGFLQSQFAATLARGERTLVLHHPAAMDAAHALPVLSRLCAHGPNNLLYVTQSETMPPGTVRHEAGGLFHGFIDVLPPPDEPDRINVDAWLSMCANTLRLIGAAAENRAAG
jgi:hypothetical protein